MHKNSFKTLLASLIAALLVFSAAGCSAQTQGAANSENAGEKHKPLVYATFFPVADLTSRIVGDKMEVKTVIKGAQEPHDFELQTSDRAEIAKADLIVYNGAGMEGFIGDLRASLGSEEKFLDLSAGLTPLRNKDAARPDTTRP